MRPYKVLSQTILFEHPWLTVYNERIASDSKESDYLLIKPNDFVVIVPFLNDKEVLMVSQYKHGSQKKLLGFPAGYINKGETAVKAARRELLEETGYQGKNYIRVAKLSENPTIARSHFYIFFVTEIIKVKNNMHNDDEEEGDIASQIIRVSELTSLKILSHIGGSPMLSAIPFIMNRSRHL